MLRPIMSPLRFDKRLRRGLHRTFLFSLLCLLAIVVVRQAQARLQVTSPTQAQTPPVLEVDKLVKQELKATETYEYSVKLEAGQYMFLTVGQRDIDVVVTLFAPDGKQCATADIAHTMRGTEPLYFLPSVTGNYRLTVQAKDKAAKPGNFQVKLEEVRTATAQDTELIASRMAAWPLFLAGEELRAQNTETAKQQAIEKYQAAVPYWRKGQDHNGEANALYQIATLYLGQANYEKAIEYFQQTLTPFRALEEKKNEAIIHITVGQLYSALGDSQKAVIYFDEALQLSRSVNNKIEEAGALNNRGLAYYYLGESQKAVEDFKQALPLRQAEKNQNGEASVLNNLGLAYEALGQKQFALNHYLEALKLYQAQKNRNSEAITLSNLGGVYYSLGDYQTALSYYQRSLEISPKNGITLTNIGGVYDKENNPQKALEYYLRALPLLQEAKDQSSVARTFINIGFVYYTLKEMPKALDYHQRALQLSHDIGSQAIEAKALQNIGSVYAAQKETEKAFAHYQQALSLHRLLGERDDEVENLYCIAEVERDRGDFKDARAHVEEALRLRESIRASISSQDLRAAYFATADKQFDLYTDILMQMHQQSPTQGLDAEALQVTERVRARSLTEMLAEASANIRQGVDAKVVARERELHQRLHDKSGVIRSLKSNKQTVGQAAALEKEVADILLELQQVQAEIKQTSPRYAALTQPTPLTVKEIQQQVLSPDTILLEYSLGENRSHLWLVTSDRIQTFTLPKRDEIEAAAQKVYELMTARTRCVKGNEQERLPLAQVKQIEAQLPAAAAALSEMLFGQVARQLGQKRLLIVADGALQSIPFGVLPVPGNAVGKEAPPLMEEHEIVYLPSASTLAVLRRELAGRKPAPTTVAVLADPVVNAESLQEYRQMQTLAKAVTKPARPKASTAGLLAAATDRATRDFGVACAGGSITRLRFSRDEAQAIAAVTSPQERQIWLGLEASRDKVLTADLTKYRIVHFATHGLLDDKTPELSGLALALLDENGKPQNGILQLHEIYNLKMNADLVVLSACETALGKQVKGEGRLSMTRGFMYAGAARVLASLWQVDDEATSELMQVFYQKLLREKLRPAAALTAAQRALRKRWPSPYYWGAFVLQGEYQ